MKTESMLAQMKLFPKNTYPIITSQSEVQYIDEYEDLKIAEIKYLILTNKNLVIDELLYILSSTRY